MLFYKLDWPKSSFRLFCKMLQKNQNELIGQPNVLSRVELYLEGRKRKKCVCFLEAEDLPDAALISSQECESWTIKKAENQRIDAYLLWCWRRLLRVPWTARRSNQSILKEISSEYSLEGLMLKLKLQYFGHLV